MENYNSKNPKKKVQCVTKCAQSLPILSSTIAAFLTEGKTVKEMENLALFLAALANDVYLIAAISDKTGSLPEELPII